MLALLFALLLLSGCGGGNSSSAPENPPPDHRPAINHPLFGYFGVGGDQLAETADHVSVVMTPDWGDWDTPAGRRAIAQQTIAWLQEAQARGIRKAIVSVGFLLWDSQWHYRGTAELAAFRQQLERLGLGPMVIATYPVDEPESKPIQDLDAIYQAVRQAWPVPVAVIYGDHGSFPGLGSADWIGFDDYGKAALRGPMSLRSDQRRILVPGGADPWRNAPEPFLAAAQADPQTVAVIAFIWLDQWGGTANLGIRSNGMADRYRAIGLALR